MESNSAKCLCGSGEFIVFSCSGASDVGRISDLVARKFSNSGVRKMNCLAVVGAGIEKSINSFKEKNILVIDGCPVDCGKKIMDRAGIEESSYLRVTDLGYKKGKTNVSSRIIDKIFEEAQVIF